MTVYRDDFITNRHEPGESPRWPMMPLAKAQSEGSRGGHIIGHTRSGKPIYQSRSAHYSKQTFGSEKSRRSSDEREQHEHALHGQLRASFSHYSAGDHEDAIHAHTRQAYKVIDQAHKLGADHPGWSRMHAVLGQHVNAADHHRLAIDGSLSKSGHGEGSRGGHIIGHTRSGDPIYAHRSVPSGHSKPLVNGHQYGLHHVDPKSLSPENPSRLHSTAYGGSADDIPLGNGHRIKTRIRFLSHGSITGGGRSGDPLDIEDPEFDITHHIVDEDDNPVHGVTPDRGLATALAHHSNALHGILSEHYFDGNSPYSPPQR